MINTEQQSKDKTHVNDDNENSYYHSTSKMEERICNLINDVINDDEKSLNSEPSTNIHAYEQIYNPDDFLTPFRRHSEKIKHYNYIPLQNHQVCSQMKMNGGHFHDQGFNLGADPFYYRKQEKYPSTPYSGELLFTNNFGFKSTSGGFPSSSKLNNSYSTTETFTNNAFNSSFNNHGFNEYPTQSHISHQKLNTITEFSEERNSHEVKQINEINGQTQSEISNLSTQFQNLGVVSGHNGINPQIVDDGNLFSKQM